MLNEDYRDMLQCLLEEKVRFVLVGASGSLFDQRLAGIFQLRPVGCQSHACSLGFFYIVFDIVA